MSNVNLVDILSSADMYIGDRPMSIIEKFEEYCIFHSDFENIDSSIMKSVIKELINVDLKNDDYESIRIIFQMSIREYVIANDSTIVNFYSFTFNMNPAIASLYNELVRLDSIK